MHKPKCGQCHEFLFNAKPVELDDTSFNKFTTKTDIPLVVDFWAAWCGPCMMMAPNFEKAAQQMEPHVRFVKVNTEQALTTASRFSIRSIPTIMILENGNIKAKQTGALGLPGLISWIKNHAL